MEVNSTRLITSELANQRVRKVLFTCVVYTNRFTLARSNVLMEHIAQQRDKADIQVSKDDPDNPKVITFSKKLQNSESRSRKAKSLTCVQVYIYIFLSL